MIDEEEPCGKSVCQFATEKLTAPSLIWYRHRWVQFSYVTLYAPLKHCCRRAGLRSSWVPRLSDRYRSTVHVRGTRRRNADNPHDDVQWRSNCCCRGRFTNRSTVCWRERQTSRRILDSGIRRRRPFRHHAQTVLPHGKVGSILSEYLYCINSLAGSCRSWKRKGGERHGSSLSCRSWALSSAGSRGRCSGQETLKLKAFW